MTVPPVSNSSTPTVNAAAASATVNYNQFLQLLVADLQNQDPTAPTDPTQYMSQLASFSSVEQQIQTNSKLDTMLTSSALSQAEQLIGQTITGPDGTSGQVSSVTLGSTGSVTANLNGGGTVTMASGSSAGLSAPMADGSTFQLPAGLEVE